MRLPTPALRSQMVTPSANPLTSDKATTHRALHRTNGSDDRRLVTTTWRSRSSRRAIACGNADRSF
ncbi:MAG: hypothetical protein AAFX40_14065 [Cyanobacteria bacterium J06639_1]